MKRAIPDKRGHSLLEMIVATSLLTIVMTSVAVVMRTGRDAWLAREGDYTRIESAHAVARHIARQARQATGVAAISAASETSGNLSLSMPSGDTLVWDHDNVNEEVLFGVNSATDLLAEDITQLKFTAYQADGTTATTTLGEIQSIKIEVQVQLPRDTNGAKTISCWVWVRAF